MRAVESPERSEEPVGMCEQRNKTCDIITGSTVIFNRILERGLKKRKERKLRQNGKPGGAGATEATEIGDGEMTTAGAGAAAAGDWDKAGCSMSSSI